MENILNVTYHSSDLFAPVLGTSIASLFENNKRFKDINVYVFENPLSDDNKNKLLELAAKYKRNIIFISMPDVNKEQNLGLKDVRAGWFFNSYMKLYLDELLPESVDKVLYLDSDVLITSDLTELWEMDMKGYAAAGVVDALGEKYYEVLELNSEAKYCNSGVILEDLRVWKEKKIGDRVREYCKENGGYVFFMEQTAFNAALQGEILILHPRYNAYTMMYCMTYEELMNLRNVKRFYSKREIDEAVANPAIMHLTNSFLITNRAWYENTNHPQKELYNSYKALTPWKDEPNFKDTRNMKQKIVQTMVDVLPRKLVITIANNLYNNRRVKMIKETIIDARKKTGLEMED